MEPRIRLKLFAVFLCCLDFSVLFWCLPHLFSDPNDFLLFLSSEHSASCVTWLSQSQSKNGRCFWSTILHLPPPLSVITVYFLAHKFLQGKGNVGLH
jgi:hypothetical protein